MWHRLTGKAREVVFGAQREAEALQEAFVAPEHILLALLNHTNLACAVLEAAGVNLEELRAEISAKMTGRETKVSPEMSLTAEGKLVLDSAFIEADSLGREYIGTEHLLLGLLHDKGGIAGAALMRLGVTRDICIAHLQTIELTGVEGRQQAQVTAAAQEQEATSQQANLKRMLVRLGDPAREKVAPMIWLLRNQGMAVEFLGLYAMGDASGALHAFLERKGLDGVYVAAGIENHLLRHAGNLEDQDKPSVADVLGLAQDLAKDSRLGPEHIVLALLNLGHNGVADVFAELDLSAEELEGFLEV